MTSFSPDCTVLVCSCDKYADLLDPFLALFRKYWPNCPFELTLVTESEPTLVGPYAFDRTIACGPGLNWASRLVLALAQVKTPYVLLLCDDYYLSEPVDTPRLLRRLNQMKTLGASNLRMIPNPKPTAANATPHEGGLFEYKKNSAYCIATQAGFWAKDFLLRLAKPVASIWEFERYGSYAVADDPRPLLVTPTKEFPFLDAVHKGHWESFGKACVEANAIPYDFTKRGLPPLTIRIKEGLKAVVFAIVPNGWIVRIQNRFALGAKEKRTA